MAFSILSLRPILVSALTLFALGSQSGSLVQRFVEALNSGDKAKLEAFVRSEFNESVPVQQRVDRIFPLTQQGAPFKLVKMVEEKANAIRALIEDKNKERLGLTLELAGSPPKIARILLADPESLNAAPPKDYSGWTDLSSLAAAICKDTGVPALGLAVWRADRPIEIAVAGLRKATGKEEVKTDDLWHIGSITKSMTATLIGKLIDLGKLRWDMTIEEALPGVPMKEPYRKVTLEQIMHHRGGIPQDMGFTAVRVNEICGNETDPVKLRERYTKNILGREPIAKPDESFAYSNAGYSLLGHIAERSMGQPYEQLMDIYVFKTLGMNRSKVGSSGFPGARTTGHMKVNGKTVPMPSEGKLGTIVAPAGDTWCSMQDLATYAKAHMDGLKGKNGLLRAATFQRLHEGVPERPGDSIYACGWSVGAMQGTALRHGHNGSNGRFFAELAFFPSQGLVVASMVNCGGEAFPSPPLQAVQAVARRYAPEK